MKAMVTGAVAMTAVLATAGTAVAADGPGTGGLVSFGQFRSVAAATAEVPEAVTYDEELVPEGAVILVTEAVREGRTTIKVVVGGLVPGHTYGTHVHTAPCGADPAASGPHYQNVAGAATPQNEVWLDITANALGFGYAVAEQDWVFREGGANAVVLHEHATSHGHDGGTPGTAGDRAACFTVPFEGE
ncbi:superoxide dismutase family protein [Streptomyces sp. NBC_01803]|uniref:superoxide dismutase family protein n=1 Tax=Streptomyces sp. NBC_01803 TaxID=2975946 RepID=UPI002DD97C3E|nr:superoxide dismutase family protein [Streptomyces sp. NBC_01803]WSA46422.1 superoxide dismutase family protein [Streptomyces sp. NBC_01803]